MALICNSARQNCSAFYTAANSNLEKRDMSKLKLSQLAETLIASEIVRLGASIKEKINNGEQVYNFTVGDFDPSIFPIPAILEEEITKAYQDGFTSYPSAEGEADLRMAISKFIEKHEGIHYSASEILVSAGGRPLIYAIFRTIVDKGDKVVYPIPSWNNNHYVHFTEGEHITVEATEENNFMPTADQLAPHLSGATLLALCSPLNPTGTTFSKNELEKICDLVLAENSKRNDADKKLYLMYDQIYWTLTHGDTHHYNPVSLRPEMKKYTIFVDGISKAFAATGVRVGWSLGPAEVIAKMRGINSHVGSWAPMAEQKATAKFLNNEAAVDAYLSNFKAELSAILVGIYDGFIQLKKDGYPVDAIAPQAAIYLTVKIDLVGKKTSTGTLLATQPEVTSYLLDEAKLALVPFSSFGASKDSCWYRLSIGRCAKREIPEVLTKLRMALDKLI